MLRKIRGHIRSNIVGYVALFVAMSGSATALQGKNTVFSDDIVNEQVKTADLAGDAVTSEKIGPNQVRTGDVADGAVNGAKIEDGALTGPDVRLNSIGGEDVSALTGDDILESTLGPVPRATLAGTGSSAQGTSCDPEAFEQFAVCASVTVNLPGYGRVLMHGYGTGYTEPDANTAAGACALYTSQTGGFAEVTLVEADQTTGGEFGLSTVTPAMGPGNVTFEVHCDQRGLGAILYEKVGISVFQIGSF